MNISILGGGNIGMCLLGEISRVKGYDVTIYTSKADLFDDKILVEDLEKKITFSSGPIKATKHMDEAIRDADIILCTIPSFLRKNIVSQVSKYIKPEACLGFFPAYGGAELYCGELIGKGVTIFGLQKVPYVARTKEVGKVAGLWSKKNQLYIASLPGSNIDKIKDFLEETLQISCEVLPNYLAVTLLPGNPLLHTSGSYVLLHNHHVKDIFPYQIYYYQSWDDSCSEMICKMSDEMEAVCKALPLDMSGVQSIQTYYESPTPTDLTRKFHSIPSFHDLTLPMIKTRGRLSENYSVANILNI